MEIKTDITYSGVSASEIEAMRPAARKALRQLWSGELDFTGWINEPHEFNEAGIDEIIEMSNEIRSKCDAFIVLGVGGSFMGAKAVIDMLGVYGDTRVIFAGYNFSGRYIEDILEKISDLDICLCVISKSGSTTETLAAYGVFKQWMLKKYGESETADRTYVITENRSNKLFDEATEEGCTILDLPLDIGGRYSVLTAVGLLPMAVAGIDISAIMKGAAQIAHPEAFEGDVLDYAIARQILYDAGKRVEVFEFFDPYFTYFGEWLKQLFGESEGKDGKGLFPTSLMFSRDLHSMGQFLQQGTSCFFETMITSEESVTDVQIPQNAMEPFAGLTIEQINKCAEKGVFDAHVKAGIPAIRISTPCVDELHVGELLYYFEMQCAVSALLGEVDPFDQPGVEAYKREMKAYIADLAK